MERDPVLDAVGSRLRELRRRRGGTLAELSETTGISVSTLSRLESGGRSRPWSCCWPWPAPIGCRWTNWSARPRRGIRGIRARPVRRGGRTLIPLTRQPGGIRAYKMIVPAGERRASSRATRGTSGCTCLRGGCGYGWASTTS